MDIILDPPEDCQNGECGHTQYVTLCEAKYCGRYANMAYQKIGPRGGAKKGYAVACSRACGEALALES